MNSQSILYVILVNILVTVQGQACSCVGGCYTSALYFPGSDGRIVNVAFGKTASMSSRYSGGDGTSGPACVAVNGKTSTEFRTLSTNNPNCVHTAVNNDPDAWWEVDLGRTYTVNNVTIYNRENAQRRMSGIHVEVDNRTCYSFPLEADNATALDALSDKIDVTCAQPLTGRVVRLQKRGQGFNYIYGSHVINVCEVQVWACRDGLYGEQCGQICSGHCKDSDPCDNYDGRCHGGCSVGYRGDECRCGHCRDGAECDNTTLTCRAGCDRGWKTPYCNHKCPPGTYGTGCSSQCGVCANFSTCRHDTGFCELGCVEGFEGSYCVAVASNEDLEWPIVGAVFGGFFAIAVGIFVGLLILRRAKARSTPE